MIFTFDHVRIAPQKQIGMHSQQTWELSYILRGSGERVIGGVSEPFIPGDLILVPRAMAHQWLFSWTPEEVENISLCFDEELLDTLVKAFPPLFDSISRIIGMNHYVSFEGLGSERIVSVLMEMDSADEGSKPSLFLRLLPLLSPAGGHVNKQSIARMDSDSLRLKRIETYIVCNYSRKVTLDEIASYVAMSKASLCVFYKNKTGGTIGGAIMRVRLDKACELLRETNMPVGGIAAATGFADSSHFIRNFRKIHGCTPSEWRMLLI